MDLNYKVSIIPAMEISREYLEVKCSTLEEAITSKTAMAILMLYLQDKLKVMSDYSNMIIIEQWDADEWIEVDEDDFQ